MHPNYCYFWGFVLKIHLITILMLPLAHAAENIHDAAFDFAFMTAPTPPPLTEAEAKQVLTVKGSTQQFTLGERRDKFTAVDWFPNSHEPAPELVMRGRAPEVSACGRCHTATGTGKPENAALAGLDKDYLVRQLQDMRSGKRVHPRSDMQPSTMFATAVRMTDSDIELTSNWYSQMVYEPVLHVEEAIQTPPVTSIGWLWALDKNGQRLETAGKIIEVSRDGHAFEKADLRDGIVAYVPPGTLARGQLLVEMGAPGIPACQSCHGLGLKGAVGPALAARYPNYMIRQMLGFANGRRTGVYAAQMEPLTRALTREDMIAVAAYAASLRP